MIQQPKKLKKMKVADLEPWDRNPRTISTRALERLGQGIERHGLVQPIVWNERTGHVVGGHQRLKVLEDAGIKETWVVPVDISEEEEAVLNIALNNPNLAGEYDMEALTDILLELRDGGFEDELPHTGFDLSEIDSMLARLKTEDDADADDIPAPTHARIAPGDLIELGLHRVLCGDSTDLANVEKLMAGEVAVLLHADPPYGMGKEKEGVINDNLYREKLDKFQMSWWEVFREFLTENASLYIWGNAEDLWRLWYNGGLGDENDLMVRNEIVWDKGSNPGMSSGGAHSYPHGSERVLFIMRGQQFVGNLNQDDYWEGYEPLRSWMEDQMRQAAWKREELNRVTGTLMASHWVSRSQFQIIKQEHYLKLQKAAEGKAFTVPYDEIGYGEVDRGYMRSLSEEMRRLRTHFDITHGAFTDIWPATRVTGDDRWEHATPKPVALCERIIRTSSEPGDLVVEPFLGSGTTLIAAENAGRTCYGMEIEPRYCDTIVERWCRFTGRDEIVINGETLKWSEAS